MEWGGRIWVTLTLANSSDHLAFFVHPVLSRGAGGEEVLPTFWSDNYFSILPGETRTVVAYADPMRLDGNAPSVRLDGWNVRTTEVSVTR
jgi:exo-1,4-beta-D-glucosaminidase